MEKNFLTLEQSLKMKELGFCRYKNGTPPPIDETCFARYEVLTKEYEFDIPNWEQRHGSIHIEGKVTNANLSAGVVAPLKQQAFKWFRDNYNIHHQIINTGKTVYPFNYKINDRLYVGLPNFYETYDEAESACLDRILTPIP